MVSCPPIILSPTCHGHLERVPTGLVWGWAPGSAGPLHVSVSRKPWWEIEASRLSAHVPKVRFQTGRSLDNQIHPVCSHPTAVGFSNGFLYPSLGWPGDFLDAKVAASQPTFSGFSVHQGDRGLRFRNQPDQEKAEMWLWAVKERKTFSTSRHPGAIAF